MSEISLTCRYQAEKFPLKTPFRISRGVRTEAVVIVAEFEDAQGNIGRGEAVPYARYGETVETVLAQIENSLAEYPGGLGLTRRVLQQNMAAGAARNALDSALWDLEVKQARGQNQGLSFADYAKLAPPQPVTTVQTISLGDVDAMAKATSEATGLLGSDCLLKIKLGGKDGGDDARLDAIRAAAPTARLVVDANEGWQVDELEKYLQSAQKNKIEMVEQPLPADQDQALANPALTDYRAGLILGADESVHTRDSLPRLVGLYDMINIKLDKTGGLTEAFDLLTEAQQQGFQIMVGCMMSTSLSMAPAFWLAQQARYVDLDGPLWMASDRPDGLVFNQGVISPPDPVLWG